MKPLLLEMQAFGPFVKKQTVDFEKLSRAGMFLIKGDTGSGKTTIFDAMTFALYGGSSGSDEKSKNGRNDLEEWRCNQATDDLDTFVSFTFSSRGRKYRFTRGLKIKRKNPSPYFGAVEISEDGEETPFFENPKKDLLTAKAEELVGLSKEQFRQVILLPQGQFERFLLADSNDKEAILTKIFGSERWAKYAERFYAHAKERKDELDRINSEIKNALFEENASDLPELEANIGRLSALKAEGVRAHVEYDGEKKQEELKEDIRINTRFEELHKLENEKAVLEGKAKAIEDKQDEYDEAEKAESLRDAVREYNEAAADLRKRKEQYENAEKELPAKAAAATLAKNKLEEHKKNSCELRNQERAAALEAKREAYKNFGALKAAEDEANGKCVKAGSNHDIAVKNYVAAVKAAANGKAEYDKADAEARECRDRYYTGIYGEIAAELEENEPCPVCGSTEHPSPAAKRPGSVTKELLEAKEAEADKKRKLWLEADERRENCEKAQKDAADAFEEKKNAYNIASAERAAAEKQLEAGIADLGALDNAINALKAETERFNKETVKLSEEADNAQREYIAAKTRISGANDEKKKAEAAFDEKRRALDIKLKEKGYDTVDLAERALRSSSQRSELLREITEYKTSVLKNSEKLSERLSELSGKIEPDKSKFDIRQSEIRKEAAAFSSNDAQLKSEIDRLTKKHAALSEKKMRYDRNIKEAEDDLSFAKKLRGDTGTGLPRYVLAVMFGQVITEANRMLEKVHGGRYRLIRTDDRGSGNKRGLELKVHDGRKPEKDGRSVAMLSGGEKFLVSMALSIGMSAVAQTTGVQIEALFIDEGFGTLDEKSINDAMDVLDSVQKSNGVIGIISHVAVLEENIPTQLEVVKSDAGSSIRLN